MAARPKSGRETRVCVAQIGAAHGLKGKVRLRSFTQEPSDFATYGPLETEDGARKLEVEETRFAKDHFVAKFEGIDDRNAAEALRNVNLYVAREKLPRVDEDGTFYHADLVGLSAVTRDKSALGEVIAVQNFGAGDILEIRRGDGSTLLLPFTETAVPEIDLAGGTIVVDPPADSPDSEKGP
ncbi:MAG: ribosome maturation factor RimM [Pseudorhodoplanes sp.]|nr:ribosome maturation factor RimM [Pseudorhodoplanes sp.]